MKSKSLFVVITLSTIFIALFALTLFQPTPVQAAGFVVDSYADDVYAHDIAPGDGICLDEAGVCTLRAAIEEANALNGADTITFNSAMTITINPTEGFLPPLTSPVTIDASTVWDNANDRPGVVLQGNNQDINGLVLFTDASNIYGLYITGFHLNGILINGANNKIGGIPVGHRNIISGNLNSGILLLGQATTNNQIANNHIGITPDGMAKQPNHTGIAIVSGASSNLIGGDDYSYGNIISGNQTYGIYISDLGTNNNRISANVLGLGLTDGAPPLGNGIGITIDSQASDTFITGPTIWAANTIADNIGAGIEVKDGVGIVKIERNLIWGNQGEGILLTSANSQVYRNTITRNAGNGIAISGSASIGNELVQNAIYKNTLKGIVLSNGANATLNAPLISAVTPNGISGTACALCQIELFSDKEDEGETYEGVTTADANGNWTYSGTFTGPIVTATARDGNKNTSEFSLPFFVGYKLYLPAVLKP